MTKLQLRDHFLTVLQTAAKEREKRPEWNDLARDFDWVLFERQAMEDSVNQYRVSSGLPRVDPALVLRADRCACGHVDYASKFALYCAELAMGENEVRP